MRVDVQTIRALTLLIADGNHAKWGHFFEEADEIDTITASVKGNNGLPNIVRLRTVEELCDFISRHTAVQSLLFSGKNKDGGRHSCYCK